MTVQALATPQQTPLSEEVIRRCMIGLFLFLSLKCTNAILRPITEGHIVLLLLVLFETSMIVLLALLFGSRNITRDINELNVYSILFHLGYLPAYFQGVPSVYHNTAINILFCIALLRLFYIGPRTEDNDFKGLPVFGILGHIRQWGQSQTKGKISFFFKHWPSCVFFGSAIPLWVVMLRSNDLVVTAIVAGLMLFIFISANTVHSEISRLRRELSMARMGAIGPTDDALRGSIRDVAAQLVASYKSTHPSMQNLNAAIAKYVERNFPEESVFNPASISARRARAATQLAELIFIGKAQLECNEQSGNTHHDIARLTAKFDESLKFSLDETGMIAFMDYVMGQPPLEVSDTTFLLACDVLTTAWMRCLLSIDAETFREEYPRLELLTREFVTRFMPYDESLENE